MKKDKVEKLKNLNGELTSPPAEEDKIRRDIFNEFWPSFQKKAIEVAEKLRQAEKAERELVAISLEAEERAREVFGRYLRGNILPRFHRLLSKASVTGIGSHPDGKPKILLTTPADILIQGLIKTGVKIPAELQWHIEEERKSLEGY